MGSGLRCEIQGRKGSLIAWEPSPNRQALRLRAEGRSSLAQSGIICSVSTFSSTVQFFVGRHWNNFVHWWCSCCWVMVFPEIFTPVVTFWRNAHCELLACPLWLLPGQNGLHESRGSPAQPCVPSARSPSLERCRWARRKAEAANQI